MTTRRAALLTLIALSIGTFTYATYAVAYAQRAPSDVPALTAADYVEIQQLVARYGFALDTGADNGYMLADMFAPGGTFNQIQGREGLAALARGGRRGPLNVRNMNNFAIIKPSREGATGIQYAQAINFGERDKKTPTEMDHFQTAHAVPRPHGSAATGLICRAVARFESLAAQSGSNMCAWNGKPFMASRHERRPS